MRCLEVTEGSVNMLNNQPINGDSSSQVLGDGLTTPHYKS